MLWATMGRKLEWKRPRNKISKFSGRRNARIKRGALSPPTPDWDDDGGSVTSEERRRGREYLESLL